MSKEIPRVTCDGCGDDITYRGNSVDYRLVLSAEEPLPWYVRKGEDGGLMTAMMIYPAVKQPKHFCNNLKCLDAWRAGPEAVAARTAERIEKAEKWNKRRS